MSALEEFEPNDLGVEYVGPFDQTYVVIDGRKVPHLTVGFLPGGIVSFVLDERFALDVPVERAPHTASFLADCIAVGMGYASHPREGQEPVPRPAFQRMREVSFQTEETS